MVRWQDEPEATLEQRPRRSLAGLRAPSWHELVPRISCDRITMTSDATFDRGSERGGAGGAAS